jgi:hypothetical protein
MKARSEEEDLNLDATYTHRHESSGTVAAPPDVVFDHLDDHARMSEHMSRRSWKTGWGRMTIDFDAGKGREVGSHIRLAGRAFGLWLELEEVVNERRPPHRKVWQTVGNPRLLVIGSYEMGFELSPVGDRTALRVFIAYSLPRSGFERVLGSIFASSYAVWCTRKMVDDAAERFKKES